MSVTEQRCSYLERLLIAALWGYKRFRRYCEYSTLVTIVLPNPADL
jgi:hypothetical protein